MAKGRAYEEIEQEQNLPPATPVGFGDLCFLALPVETFKALSDEAAKRGLTFAQLLQKALDDCLKGSAVEPKRLLVEQGGKR
jgi:hypothetical protein